MDLVRANAANLVDLKPDAIVAIGGRVIPVLKQLTRTVPIIIPGGADPVGMGYIENLARPGGNVTGFATIEFSVFGKILETLKGDRTRDVPRRHNLQSGQSLGGTVSASV